MRNIAIVGLALLLMPGILPAQPGRAGASGNCHGVLTSTLASGHEHRDLQSCAAQISSELPRILVATGTQTDTLRLMLLHRMTLFVRDPAIFTAGLELAQNSAAAPAARVLGLHVAFNQIDPTIGIYSSGASRPFRMPLSEFCEELGFSADEPSYLQDNGLAGGAEGSLRSVARHLAGASSEPLMVRRFAGCILLVLPDPEQS